jgi:hypothetical protein
MRKLINECDSLENKKVTLTMNLNEHIKPLEAPLLIQDDQWTNKKEYDSAVAKFREEFANEYATKKDINPDDRE